MWQESHTALLLIFPHSIKAVVSTGLEIRNMVHGIVFCNSNLFPGNFSLKSLKLVLLVLSSGGWAGAGVSSWDDMVPARSLLRVGTMVHFLFSGFYSEVIKFGGTCCLLLWQATHVDVSEAHTTPS